MAKINLLPWRTELRKEQQRQYFTIMGLIAVFVVLLVVLVHLQYVRLLDNQTERNKFLEKEIVLVKADIKEIEKLAEEKDRLIERMKIIQRLQRNRPEIVHLFDEIVRVIPDGLHLIGLTQNSNIVNIKGVAQSNARVSTLMRNISDSDWLDDPKLQYIEKVKGEGEREFVLIAKQKSGDDEQDKEDGLTPAPAGAKKP